MFNAIRKAVRLKRIKPAEEATAERIEDANAVVAFSITPEWRAYSGWLEKRLAIAMKEAFESLGSNNREAVLLKVAEAAAYYQLMIDVESKKNFIEVLKQKQTQPDLTTPAR
jgi:DNA-directed RNA polymerase specialized sigma24 family protein